jgi:hypothetical protein
MYQLFGIFVHLSVLDKQTERVLTSSRQLAAG